MPMQDAVSWISPAQIMARNELLLKPCIWSRGCSGLDGSLLHSLTLPGNIEDISEHVRHVRKNKGLLQIVPAYKNCQWPLSPYPKHAGEADPGPGPPGQSGRQGKGDRGHPERRPTWGISTTLTVGLYGIPRNSRQLHTGTGDSDPCQTCEMQQSLEERERRCCFLSLSPSLTALVTLSLACEFPPSEARCTSFYSWSFALSCSLVLSLLCPPSVSA